MRPRKPVCVQCEKTFRPCHNGAYLVELYCDNELVYKIWHCDIYGCPECETRITYGFGENPIMTNADGEKKCRKYIENLKKDDAYIVYDYEQ